MSDEKKRLELPGGGFMFFPGTPKREEAPPKGRLRCDIVTEDEADDTDPAKVEEVGEAFKREWECDFDSAEDKDQDKDNR